MSELVDQIVEIVAQIMTEDRRPWAGPKSDPVGDVRRIADAYKQQYENNPYPDFKDK